LPELPEVEVVRLGLRDHVVGRTVSEVRVLHPRAVRRHVPGAADFAARLAGRRLTAARRRGKYLWIELDEADPGDEAVLLHLGMSGQLLIRPPHVDAGKHSRIAVDFTDAGSRLWFDDQRTFGGLFLAELTVVGGATVPVSIAHIARDLLDEDFDVERTVAALRRRRTGLKRALLDQTLLSGVGNIYADEALWRARLHWATPTETMTGAEARRLLDHARAVMTEALAQGGTSFDALYVNVNGQSGYFDRSLNVYGRVDRSCRRCGTPIVREPFMNRSSFRCPYCQPEPADLRL
jgi:formamidopyrimidine-DNA glycosylase